MTQVHHIEHASNHSSPNPAPLSSLCKVSAALCSYIQSEIRALKDTPKPPKHDDTHPCQICCCRLNKRAKPGQGKDKNRAHTVRKQLPLCPSFACQSSTYDVVVQLLQVLYFWINYHHLSLFLIYSDVSLCGKGNLFYYITSSSCKRKWKACNLASRAGKNI